MSYLFLYSCFYSPIAFKAFIQFPPAERASVPRARPRVEQVEEGAAAVWERGALHQQPRHHPEMVSE